MKINKEAIKKGLKNSLNGLFIGAGIGGVGYGAWMIYEPAAFLAVGAIFIWIGLPD